jgi:hypothetical protein
MQRRETRIRDDGRDAVYPGLSIGQSPLGEAGVTLPSLHAHVFLVSR